MPGISAVIADVSFVARRLTDLTCGTLRARMGTLLDGSPLQAPQRGRLKIPFPVFVARRNGLRPAR
jgi:hypothetical protein